MTNDLRQACVEAMRRIQRRLEKQHWRDQERFLEFCDSELSTATAISFEMSEWGILLQQLPSDEQRVVLDIVIHGHTEQEMAELMGWSLSRVHRTKKRALTALRRMLDE